MDYTGVFIVVWESGEHGCDLDFCGAYILLFGMCVSGDCGDSWVEGEEDYGAAGGFHWLCGTFDELPVNQTRQQNLHQE